MFNVDAATKIFSVVGALYSFMEILDFFSIYTKDHYSKFALVPMLIAGILWAIVTRRPVSRIAFKVPQKDYTFEVKIGDIFAENCDIVISSNTTFDTNIASGLISANSLQGQLAFKTFQGNTAEIDRQLEIGLQNAPHTVRANAPGKSKEYAIGTVAKVVTPEKNFYFVAMSRLNDHGNAKSTLRNIEDALSGLWQFVADQGDLRTIAIPLMGTGRGRVDLPRKKMIERIAQSFADASKEKVFSNRLIIVIRPEDAENFGVNMFEVRDYLIRSLHT